jgi:putative ABC transport system permease protein
MFKNYLKVAIRALLTQKLISIINILGLTIGIAITLLIVLFIYDETHYDTFHKDYERIYRLESTFRYDNEIDKWAATSGLLKNLLDDKFIEVESSVRLMKEASIVITIEDQKFKETNMFWVDSSFVDVFDLSLIKGNVKSALNNPNSIVLSEKTALKFFGTTDVLGKTIPVYGEPKTISGVMANSRKNTHLNIDILAPITSMEKRNPGRFQGWTNLGFYTYVKLNQNTDISAIESKLARTCYELGSFDEPDYFNPTFHAINDIHLGGNGQYEITKNSDWLYVYIFATIGLLIIVLASINYVNLTTSNSMNRAKEIGIRKTLGALKSNLITQFLIESVLITLLAFVLAILVVFIVLPEFNNITNKELSFSSFYNLFFIAVSVGVVIFIGLLAGLYPAFVLSSFQPANVIKGITGNSNGSKFSFGLKKSLVILQFAISIFLLIASLVVIDQISYMFNKPLGFVKQNVIVVPVTNASLNQLNTFKNELKRNPAIINASYTSTVPGVTPDRDAFMVEGHDEVNYPHSINSDHEYLEVMKMKIVKGRNFDSQISSDISTAFIINEAAAERYEWTEPIGKKIQYTYNDSTKNGKVIGVVQNFHQESQHGEIEPMIMQVSSMWIKYVTIRYAANAKIDDVKTSMVDAWNKSLPNDIYSFSILTDDLNNLYKAESSMKQLLIIFSLLAIFISSLGLFALISFSTQLRRKEIGIRKTLGATNWNIIFILSKEYIVLILIALIISLPLSYYSLNIWLSNFVFRIDISVVSVLIAIIVSMIIAFITLFTQGLKAALKDPINSLRVE